VLKCVSTALLLYHGEIEMSTVNDEIYIMLII
jgi:hypothetical protein